MAKNNGRTRNIRVKRLRSLVFTLYLHSDWQYVTRNMTTEERELFADTIDIQHKADFPDDFEPVDRWWRQGN